MLGDQLGIGGLMPLPGRLRSCQDRDIAVATEPHGRGVRTIVAARLDIGGKTDASELSRLFRNCGALAEPPPVNDLLGASHMPGKIAGVVDLLSRRRVGHRLRLYEI